MTGLALFNVLILLKECTRVSAYKRTFEVRIYIHVFRELYTVRW